MNLWAVIAALASLRGLGSGRRWLDALVVGGLCVGVVMTLSRTGLLGMAIGGLAVLWRERTRERRGPALRFAALVVVATGVLLAGLWAIDPSGVGGDLTTGLAFRFDQGVSLGPGEPDIDGGIDHGFRGEVWPIYVDFFREHPVRGVGLGTGWATAIQEPHNIVLELLGETGLIGFTGFTVLLVTILRSSVNPLGRTALVVAFAASMTQTVLFEATWWFAAGLAVAPPVPDRVT
jgi:O-antigen ligase